MTAPDKIIASFHGNMVIGEKTCPYGPWFAVDNPLRSSGVEYTRLDPNTRVVTVDQLGRWAALIYQVDIQDDYGWNIGDKSMVEIRAIIWGVK